MNMYVHKHMYILHVHVCICTFRYTMYAVCVYFCIFPGASSALSFLVAVSPCTHAHMNETTLNPPGNVSMMVPVLVSFTEQLPLTITSSEMQPCIERSSCQEYIVSFSTSDIHIAREEEEEEEERDDPGESIPSLVDRTTNGSVSVQCQAVHSHSPWFPVLIAKPCK